MVVEGSNVSPKGVADIEVSMDSVVEKIRDRREAVLEGKVTPSTIPNFPSAPPSTPVRRSLVSIDDEEIETYRIEITTDNVVRQSVPARFSASEKEEYLAEFDMVDTEGGVIPPPKISRTHKVKASPTSNGESKKGKFAPFAFGTGSKDQSGSLKSSSSKLSKKSVETAGSNQSNKPGRPLMGLRKRTNSTEASKELTVRDLIHVETEHVRVETAPPQRESEDEALDESMEVPAPQLAVAAAAATVVSQVGKDEDETTPRQLGEKVEAADSPPKPSSDSNDQAAKSARKLSDEKAQAVTSPPPPPMDSKRSEAKSTPNKGGIFSSFRKRTNSGKNKSVSKSSPRVAPKVLPPPPAEETKPARPMPPQEEGVWPEPSIECDGTPTTSPARKKDGEKDVGPRQLSQDSLDSKLEAAKEQTVTKSTPVDLDESIVPSVVPSVKEGTETKSPDKKLDDDTKSTESSTTSGSKEDIKPPTSFPGEAAVEKILEKFFDHVTCSCINDRCADRCGTGEAEDKELPNYMVVEIQKIHQKAQAKKAEIAEKKQARRASKSKEKGRSKSIPPVKDKVAKLLASSSKREKKDKKSPSMFDMKQSSPKQNAAPTNEWGEKVLEQDSVTTASSVASDREGRGFTVGAFIQKKFGLLENSIAKEMSGDEKSADVDESDAGEDGSVDRLMSGAILKISPVRNDEVTRSVASTGAAQARAPGREASQPEERVILLRGEEDGSESLLDAPDEDDDSLGEDVEDDDSEYTTELIQVDFDPSKLGNTTDADMYLAREVLRRYAEITGISLDELIEDVVDESLASLTLDAYGFPMDREGSQL